MRIRRHRADRVRLEPTTIDAEDAPHLFDQTNGVLPAEDAAGGGVRARGIGGPAAGDVPGATHLVIGGF